VIIGPALDERLQNIAVQTTTHGTAIARGKLDLYNTGECASGSCDEWDGVTRL
jgi:hypothetical protein